MLLWRFWRVHDRCFVVSGMWDEWICWCLKKWDVRLIRQTGKQAVRDETRLIECRRRRKTSICNRTAFCGGSTGIYVYVVSRCRRANDAGQDDGFPLCEGAATSQDPRRVLSILFYFLRASTRNVLNLRILLRMAFCGVQAISL